MFCPKCGFRQPDEIYCAKCGINVVKYSRARRKRLYARAVTFVFISIGIALSLSLFHLLRSQEPGVNATDPSGPSKESSKKRMPIFKAVGNPTPEKPRVQRQLPSVAVPGTERSSLNSDTETAVNPDADPGERPPGAGQEWTAGQWFESGRALNDDSAEEMNCYLTAIQLDPKFAPAYYALGGIHFRLAEYEQADRFFRNFLEFASEEDRQAYDIYVYYSPEEVETLAQKVKTDGTRVVDKEKAPSPASTKAEQNQDEPSGSLSDRELKTVVPFRSLRGHIGVSVLLNDRVGASMLLDTGAGVTLLSKKMVSDLGLSLSNRGSVNLMTISEDVKVPVAKLTSIRLGDLKKMDFQVAVSDLNFAGGQFDGILGMDFLGDFDIRIDNQIGRITLRGRPTKRITKANDQ